MRVRVPVVVWVVLLAMWPLTFLYSSVGVDVEHVRGEQLQSRMWRVRWPGDGTVLVGWIDEHRSAAPGVSPTLVDPAALVLQPPRPMRPRTTANRWGFWYIHVDASRGDPPSDAAPRADRVVLAGAPHWLLVLAATLAAAWAVRRGGFRRHRSPAPGRVNG